ncbi:hypothetical protein ANO14919_062650 [Xylariales sp. No.14919]|nr:hypothetical protein ANO14919_062650 [Xylariales sp. No.14919]
MPSHGGGSNESDIRSGSQQYGQLLARTPSYLAVGQEAPMIVQNSPSKQANRLLSDSDDQSS